MDKVIFAYSSLIYRSGSKRIRCAHN
ncbi:MAG: hypothetical protein GQ571_11755 [Desulfobacterales bacterium]|nr:hypothetical protein [Desulfobacterales bacterium]